MVTRSWIRLWSPISTRVALPQYDRSWGSPPIATNGPIVLNSPIRTDPSKQTWPDQLRPPSDLDIGTDHAAWPDDRIFGHPSTGIDPRRLRDQKGHGTTPFFRS